jgi:hypothetical protein
VVMMPMIQAPTFQRRPGHCTVVTGVGAEGRQRTGTERVSTQNHAASTRVPNHAPQGQVTTTTNTHVLEVEVVGAVLKVLRTGRHARQRSARCGAWGVSARAAWQQRHAARAGCGMLTPHELLQDPDQQTQYRMQLDSGPPAATCACLRERESGACRKSTATRAHSTRLT